MEVFLRQMRVASLNAELISWLQEVLCSRRMILLQSFLQ
jgi:hypothetical protein